ncbi:hypothetical protein ScPMuIL_017238 [Solemya velum]
MIRPSVPFAPEALQLLTISCHKSRMKSQASLVICLSLIGLALSAVPQDEVKSLPGLKKQPFWHHYSGYLKASGTKKLHYWFVESANNPQTDPVVLWMNGGPGCSSLLGLLTENGPFRITDEVGNLDYNPQSWNKIANVLFLEAPAGVGFSYSDDKNYTTDDDQVARDNYLALKDFFSKYPEFSTQEFFVTGESYGGIYVPTLSALVLADKAINFKGSAIGNGISDYSMNGDSIVYFAYFHGLIGESLWGDLLSSCCGGNATRCRFSQRSNVTQCQAAIDKVMNIIYSGGLNEYNLYAPCLGETPGIHYDASTKQWVSTYLGWQYHSGIRKKIQGLKDLPPSQLRVTPPCVDLTSLINVVNGHKFREALHIPALVPDWQPCSGQVIVNYRRVYTTMRDFYLKILAAGKRMLVYNGDVDMACNFLGDEWFVDDLNIPVIAARKAWYYLDDMKTKQVAGFVKQFKDITFVTVRGSGHMVPTDRPIPAFDLFEKFIKNQPF